MDATAAKRSLVPFALGDPCVLGKLASDAGFETIEIETATFTRYVEPTQEWLLQDTAGLPYSTTVASMDSVTRAAMIREIASKLKPDWNANTFAVPMQTYIVIAHT